MIKYATLKKYLKTGVDLAENLELEEIDQLHIDQTMHLHSLLHSKKEIEELGKMLDKAIKEIQAEEDQRILNDKNS